MKKYLLLLLLPALAGCMSAEDKELRAALDMAGENRAELEHVLDFFASDSLKSRAARFLIANMPASYGYMPETQSELESVYQDYDSINRVYAYQTGEEWGKSIDDLSHRCSYKWGMAGIEPDLHVLKSEYLIREIERSVEVWKKNAYSPYCSFDDFLEYVLPYRRLNGLIADNARDTFYHRHIGRFYCNTEKGWQVETDSLLYEYRQLVHSKFFGTGIPLLTASAFERLQRGLCIHRCWFNSLLLSSLGMPVAVDFVPAWGNRNNSHTWNVLMVDGESHAFEAFWDYERWRYKRIYNNESTDIFWGKFRLPKVYRYTYSNHVEGPVADGRMRREDIPPLFRNIKKKDVSREYFTVRDVEVDLTAPIPSGVRYAYLAVFGYQQWHPVQWGKIKDGGKVVFKDMGMDMVYLPVYYMKGGVHPAGQVFKLDSEGRKHFLSDNGTRGKVRLRTVFGATSHGKNRKCLHSLRGARLYGLKDGIPAEELCQLTDSLGIGRNKFAISASSSFRHVRLVLPSDSLAAGEITFHTDQGIIRPVHVDTEMIPLSEGEDAGRLTDGDDATVARCRVPKGYVDFDLGTTCHLTGMSVFPYLHSQLVQGDSYELRYWDGQWKTLESKQCADDGTIEFEGVPLNSLLMLKDLNWPGATAERIFMCRDGEVCWE